MKMMNKQTLLIWAVVVLVVLNLSTLATFFFLQQPERDVKAPAQLETYAEKYSGRYFRDQLNLDRDQMDHFRGFNPPFRKKALEISEAMTQTRKAMLEEMAAPVCDTLKLNRMADSIGSLHRDLKNLTWHYYLDLKSICTPDQQVLLKKLFTDMFINDIPMGHPGRGQGWQRGRNR